MAELTPLAAADEHARARDPGVSERGRGPDSDTAPMTGVVHLGGPAPHATRGAMERGAKIGRYHVLDCCGRGAMGVVYAAYDPELDRKVALKVLNTRVDLLPRIREEARILAKIRSPHVVSVFDVGSFTHPVYGRESFYIAMELVQGGSLREWLGRGARSWRDVVAAFIAAGRGLADAHALGVVHRDFKPANVLIAEAGEVKVADFGLAVGGAFAAATGVDARPGDWPYDGYPSGTPRYMAPEAGSGGLDARSDIYSFCVALFEALYDAPPFAGATLREIMAAKRAGPVRPQRRRGPRRLLRIVLEGLAPDPSARPPTMVALLDALERLMSRRRRLRRALAPGLAAALCVGIVASTRAPDPEALARQRAAELWSAEAKAELARALVRGEAAHAERTAALTIRAIDSYVDEWREAYVDTLRAKRRGELLDSTIEARLRCLRAARRSFETQLRVITEADADISASAIDAFATLDPPRRCAHDSAGLESRLQPPEALAPAVDAVDDLLVEARSLRNIGLYTEGLRAADDAVAQAAATEHPPVLARALLTRGSLHNALGDHEAARADVTRASEIANSFEDPTTARASALELFSILAAVHRSSGEVELWDHHVRALVHQEGAAALDRSRYYAIAAIVAKQDELYDRANELNELAIQALGRSEDAGSAVEVWRLRQMSAEYLAWQGKYAESNEARWQNVAEAERLYGPDHPRVLDALIALARGLMHAKEYDYMISAMRRAEALARREGARLDDVYLFLGIAYHRLGALDLAAEHLAQAERAATATHSRIAALANLAEVEAERGRYSRSLELSASALEMEPDHESSLAAVLEMNRTRYLYKARRCGEALARSDALLELIRRLAPQTFFVSELRSWRAAAYRCLGELRSAESEARAALDLADRSPSIAPSDQALHRLLGHLHLAEVYADMGRADDVREHLRRAQSQLAESTPPAPEVWQRIAVTKARERLLRGEVEAPDELVAAIEAQARIEPEGSPELTLAEAWLRRGH